MNQGSRTNPFLLVVLAFLFTMMLGGFLLTQPFATTSNISTNFIDALFTSASALFVTGLAVVETGSYWSFSGQLIILVLIQIGALGVVTIGGYLAHLFGQRLYFADRKLLGDDLGADNKGEVTKILKNVVFYVLLIEFLGAILLTLAFYINGFEFYQSLTFGIFHSVSAFANAGFDIFGSGDSARSLLGVGWSLEIIAALIFVGGLGFPVWLDLLAKIKDKNNHRLSLHSRIVLLMSISLIFLGAIAFWYFDRETRLYSVSGGQHIREAFFHSVSSRTAGFAVYDLSQMSKPSILTMITLMFIGGSPASTAGGIKVTVAAILILMLVGVIKGDLSLHVMKRQINAQMAIRALSVAVISMLLIFLAVILIELFDDPPFLAVLFEAVSAMGTVGLSLRLTASLSDYSKLTLIFIMFMGRVGLYTLLYGLIFYSKRHKVMKEYPKAELCL